MRIIAGTFRSRQLKPLKKLRMRPTSDMLRETLFNILGPRVESARFLDRLLEPAPSALKPSAAGQRTLSLWKITAARHS